MADLGMPNSTSLFLALQQVANEAAQESAKEEREQCAILCEEMVLYTGYDCAVAIRKRPWWRKTI